MNRAAPGRRTRSHRSNENTPNRGTLGVGIIGMGGAASQHMLALSGIKDARLVGVCDVDPHRAHNAAMAQQQECRWTDSITTMLKWPELDAVIVCTPSSTHVDIGRRAASAGKHLLVEKPLGIDLGSIDDLIAEAARAGVVLMPGHTHRFYDYSQAIRAAIPDRVGQPLYARLSFNAGWIWGGWSSWVLSPALSGGHVVHNGVHGLDLVTWWMSDTPVEISAVGQKATAGALEVWDYFEVGIRFRRGGAAVVEMSRAHRPQETVEREALVAGTEGILSIQLADWGGEVHTERGTVPIGFDGEIGFKRQAAAFVDAVVSGHQPPVTPAEGRLAVAMALTAEEAIQTGKPVRIA